MTLVFSGHGIVAGIDFTGIFISGAS